MILAALAAFASSSASTSVPLETEQAFDAAAAREGQWTAFRAFAEPGAIMLPGPKPVSALAGLPDPPASVRWQAQTSYVSCDGSMAVDTGAWQRPDGSTGWFTTVWHRQLDGGWKYRIDLGDTLPKPLPKVDTPGVQRAACPATPIAIAHPEYFAGPSGDGGSDDGSLQYHWHMLTGTTFEVALWNGHRMDTVRLDRIKTS